MTLVINKKTYEAGELIAYVEKLEKENAELTDRLDQLQEQNSHMFNTIALQEQQIEKMKNCNNCKYGFCSWSSESIDKNGRRTCHAWNEDKQAYCDIGSGSGAKYQLWEMKEND